MGKLFNQLNEAFFQQIEDKNIKIEESKQIDKIIEEMLPEISDILLKQLFVNAGEMLQE